MTRPLNGFLTLAGTVAVGSLAMFAAWAPAQTAQACGGCFAPSETVTVVTGHRMAVAISADETTLWDQIQYAGEPEDFVWVLPIEGEQLVELADNAFFDALNQASQITLQGTFPPIQNFCPDPCDMFSARASADGSTSGAPPSEPEVMVFGTAVVGPYETATIGSEDPMALINWLRDNGYAVPDSILPTIAHYTNAGQNFAVLRLSPGEGVNQMQPVRVTTSGTMPVFPLRMVAAGVSGSVALDLFVLAEGRYEAANFEVAEVDPSRLIYDWDKSAFNYNEVFDAMVAENGGRVWVAEYAQGWESYQWVQNFTTRNEDGSEDGSARDDFDVVLRSLASPYLTRLRTNMDASHLTEDLVLQASLEGQDISNQISVDREINRPPDVSCPTTCNDPSRRTGGRVGALGFRSGGGGGGCAVNGAGTGLAGIGLLVIALGLLGRRRKRRL